MSRLRAVVTGLGTRVATRTFLVFAVCAIIPIALFALIADRVVERELREVATNRLTQASKSYGLLIFERLKESDELLSRLADATMAGVIGVDDARKFTSRRVRILDVQTGAALADSEAISTLSVGHEATGERSIRMVTTRSLADQYVTITAIVLPDYLWNADAVELPARLCVRELRGALLSCVGETVETESTAAEWSLYLRSAYGADAWLVEARQPTAIAFETLHGFRRTLPIIAGLAIGLALLFSVVQIRRSHRPLTTLVDAARRIGERRTVEPVVLDDRDEYGRLGLAFNQMAASIARQFAMLRALARIDRMILTNPSFEAVLERTLPELPRLLRSRTVAFFVQAHDSTDTRLYIASRDDGSKLRAQRLTLTVEELRSLMQDDALSERVRALRNELLAASKCSAFETAAVRVERRLRGVLLVAHTIEDGSPDRRRSARSFGRRLAVALGAEERRQALLHQAYYDDLTGLPNRQLFKDRLQQELAHARRTGEGVALIYIDLDRFKTVNDSFGHTAGDELLKLAGKRIGGVMREADTLARLGGDEFVVIATGVRESPAHVLAERLEDALSAPATICGADYIIEASMGIALFPQDGATAELLLRNADTAMYRAKASGGGRAVYFEEGMNRDAMRRMHVEQRLRLALARGALTLAYQPKIRTHDGAIWGVEALARWTDAELGVVSPEEFIPVAEECGLIEELGEWAMREACLAYNLWRRSGVDVGHVSVNVSLRQLRDERFLRGVRSVLLETHMSPGALELEVTESTLAECPSRVMKHLDDVRALGVRIAIDDFGVGYSSMAALGHLPADVLKIDRSFIEHCATRPDAASIVEAIVSMAHALGKLTVAEGVETPEQLALLKSLGCDLIQGYLFSKALPSAEMMSFAAARQTPAAPLESIAPPAKEAARG